jgi:hypothetical protein
LFGLALTQGQGWEHIGEHTLYWYSVWFQGGVRLATWPRDRLGYFEVVPQPQSRLAASPHFVSFPIPVAGADRKVFVNASGLSERARLTVEIYDHQLRPLPGFSGEGAARIAASGFRQPAEWKGATTLPTADRPIRVRVNFEGEDAEELRVYAVYVATE